MKERFMYRMISVRTRPGMKVQVFYHEHHHNVLAAEREAQKTSRQPESRDDRVLVEEFHQKVINDSPNGWQSDPTRPPVRVSQWKKGHPLR